MSSSTSPFHPPDAHPHDLSNPRTATTITSTNIHNRILQDTRSTTITLAKHRRLQQKMRSRTNSSNRDLLKQALNIRTTANKNHTGILSIIDQAKRLKLHSSSPSHSSNRSNDFMHTIKSFDRALLESGSTLKVLIMVGFKIQQVLRIDHVHLTFYTNFSLFVEWNDPRLVGMEDPTTIDWSDDKYFDPKMIVINGMDVECYGNKKVLVDPLTGLVKQTLRLKGNLTIHETSFGAFPYDYQDLRIQVQSNKYPGHSVLLVSTGTSLIEHHPREEWSLSGLRTEVYTTNPHASMCGNSFSALHIVIMVERDPAWYKRNILATLSLIWAAAMVTLFMPFSTYDALGYRMESAVALLLASVATKFTVTEHLPKVSVLTLCESHMNMCFLGILINIATSILLYVIEKYADKHSLSESMSDSERFTVSKMCFNSLFLFDITIDIYSFCSVFISCNIVLTLLVVSFFSSALIFMVVKPVRMEL